MKRYVPLLTFLPVLAISVMIFCFSSQTSTESSGISAVITEFVLESFYPKYDFLNNTDKFLVFNNVCHIIRKLAHFTEFFLLGFFLNLHIKTIHNYKCADLNRKLYIKIAAISIVIGVLYAITDEMHQMMVSGRVASGFDVLIDSLGVFCGVIFLMFIWRLFDVRKHCS